MQTITKCLNEWNPVIEALGQGKQTLLVRKYVTTLNKFLLYPTVSYTLRSDYQESFQEKYQSFASDNELPKIDGKKMEVKYFAKVQKVIEKHSKKNKSFLKDYYVWTPEHVKSYIGGKKAYIWILRVYALKKPVMAERTKGIRYSNLLEPVTLDAVPVLSDAEFDNTVKEIESRL